MTSTDTAELVQYVVYQSPRDYPDKFVVRRWKIAPDSLRADADAWAICATLDDARAHIPPGLLVIPRFPEDEAQIVEVWM